MFAPSSRYNPIISLHRGMRLSVCMEHLTALAHPSQEKTVKQRKFHRLLVQLLQQCAAGLARSLMQTGSRGRAHRPTHRPSPPGFGGRLWCCKGVCKNSGGLGQCLPSSITKRSHDVWCNACMISNRVQQHSRRITPAAAFASVHSVHRYIRYIRYIGTFGTCVHHRQLCSATLE